MTEQEDQRTEEEQAATEGIRKQIAAGFAFVRSREVNQSVAAVTMEESIAQAIVAIEDDRSDIRPGMLSKIRSLQEDVLAAIDRAMEMPADAFDHPDQGSANTEEEEESE